MNQDGVPADREASPSRAVIATFRLGEREYLVLRVEQDTQQPSLPRVRKGDCVTEVCRFAVGTQLVAIIEHTAADGPDPLRLLTARELQIAALVAEGCPNKQIASRLRISEWTVATYLRRIFVKLGVDSRAAMTYRCASLIDLPPGRPARSYS